MTQQSRNMQPHYHIICLILPLLCFTELHPLLFHKHFGMEHLKFKFQYLFIPFTVKEYQNRNSCESFISSNVNHILSFCLRVQIPLPYRLMDIKSAIYWLSPDFNQKVYIFPRTVHANQIHITVCKCGILKIKLTYICPEIEYGFDSEALMIRYRGVLGGVVVKTLRYQSDDPGIDSL